MNTNRNTMALIAVAGLAFAAGRYGLPAGQAAGAQPPAASDHDVEAAYREATSPGPHHRHLEAMLGVFTGEFTLWTGPDAPPMVSHGTVRRTWTLDGRFLRESVVAESDHGTFRGIGFIGYNNLDGRYQTVWMDNMSTAIHTESGTYHHDTKILHTRGSQRDPVTGKVTTTWAKLNMSDPDRHTAKGWAVGTDGRVYTAFEGTLQREP